MSENSSYKLALSKSMALCSSREYCISDIRTNLSKWGIGERDSDKIIEELVSNNFINELRYAKAFTNDKFKHNKWGKGKIRSHLKLKNLTNESINSALSSIDEGLYRDVIRDLLEKHKRIVKFRNQYELKSKLIRFGLSRGFESNILYDILGSEE